MSTIRLVCPVCGYERTLDPTENYTQADLMCPSDEHPDTDLVRDAVVEVADDEEPPAL